MSRQIPPAPVFVVFEGLDGSGKTTCARRVAEQLDAVYLTTPSPSLRRLRGDVLDSFEGSQEAAQLFYLATVFHASGQARAHLAAGRSVVLDRYFVSTQAYAAFRGSKLDLDHLAERLTRPNLTVFLQVPLAVRRARLAARGATTADRETLSPSADRRLMAEHQRRQSLAAAGAWIALDADAPPEVVAEDVLRSLIDVTD